ncbi:tRNA (guanosine(37)-N1)-methyltransferase TrmD [Thermoactinomyces sp. DSM 45892]|uniref:tRNA (guanosine(37)-N1)-methyltransferase TrmD n=1 Tax=Thermoactinomyces sp. DSM 45892 TaxID=1882753 RepID=UPI000B870CB2|nr:tRNA (guanosine(37)-N1)-methyltransferase TrmD [Thermoactinomyces sp. DSM 45892]
MRFDVLTLFPEMFHGFLSTSIIRKAHEKGLIETNVTNFRQFATDKHQTVDDTPYGGGGGMVLKPQPLFDAVDHLLQDVTKRPPILLMSPQGTPFTQKKAEELSEHSHLIFLCGHYEGFDERIRQHLVTEEISVGDFVLTGGELPAMVIMDSVSRLIPGVLGNHDSAVMDSFSNGLLEYPHYTRPAEFRGLEVPEILLSGHHANMEKWRREQSLERTWTRRPDLLKSAPLTEEDREFLRTLEQRKRSE